MSRRRERLGRVRAPGAPGGDPQPAQPGRPVGQRLPLLLADFAALQPDLIGLQEVVTRCSRTGSWARPGPPRTRRGAGGPGAPNTATPRSSGRAWPCRPRLRRPTTAWTLASPARRCASNSPLMGGRRSASSPCTSTTRPTRKVHAIATSRPHSCWSGWRAAGRARHDRGRRLQRQPARTGLRAPYRVFRSASVKANGREPDVTWPSASRRRPWTPMATRCASTTSGSGARPGRDRPARLRPPRGRRPDPLPLGPRGVMAQVRLG